MKQRELALALKVVDIIALACCIAAVFYRVNKIGILLTPVEGNIGSALRHATLPFGIIACIPFIIIAIIAWKLFNELARDNSFCRENAQRLRTIGFVSAVEALLFIIATTVVAIFGNIDADAFADSTVIIIACGALTIVCFTLSHLFAKASALQDENDLTV